MFDMNFAVAMHEAMPGPGAANLCLEDWLGAASWECNPTTADMTALATQPCGMFKRNTCVTSWLFAESRLVLVILDYALDYGSTGSKSLEAATLSQQ